MAQPKLFSWLRLSLARLRHRFDGKSQRRQHAVPVRLHLESLEDRVVPTPLPVTVTLPLDNQTGLNPAQYSIYMFGFGQTNASASNPNPTPFLQSTELGSDGKFHQIAANTSGTILGYNISTELSSITLSSATPVNSGILYFIVVPHGQSRPTLTYTTDNNDVLTFTSGLPGNPPNRNPPFAIVEITEPADNTNYPVIDASAVNGFSFPLTVTLNTNQQLAAGNQVGQPLSNPAVNRASILDAYTSFMDRVAAGTPYLQSYLNLEYAANSIASQAGGIVSPALYLAAPTTPSNDPLNTVWDSSLNQLFGKTTGGPNGTGGMTLNMYDGVDSDYYVGTPKNVTLGGNVYRVLDFIGYKTAAENTIPLNTNGNEFWIFSPLTPDPSLTNPGTAGYQVFGGAGVFADDNSNVLNGSTGPSPSAVALRLELEIDAALNRGVATLTPANTSTAGYTSILWGNEKNWYPAGQTENLYSLFMHTATINGTPIFTLPSGAVTDAQGTLMAQAYGFSDDETPADFPPGSLPTQPNVPAKWEPANGATKATITLGPWFQPPPPSPSPSSSSSSSSNSSSANANPFELVNVFILAQDEFTFMVDGLFLRFTNNPMFTQAADRVEDLLDHMISVDNQALFTGLSGLQSAIYGNPYWETMWGSMAEVVALYSAAGVFANPAGTLF